MSTLQERLSVLESTVMGNGNKGHKDRLRDLEDKEANMSCQTGIYIKRYIERMEKKRTYRIGDIANVLNAVGLLVVMAKLFFWGGVMISIDRLNDRQIYELFGDPKDAGPKKYIVKTATPFPLYMAGRVIKSVEINKYIIESWLDALEEIRDTYGSDLHKLGLDEFGGCYNIRAAKGNTAFLSRHAWGLAVDHLMTLGPYGRRDILPYHFVMAFLKRGWDWGGHWPEMYPGCTVLDGMHFSVGG